RCGNQGSARNSVIFICFLSYCRPWVPCLCCRTNGALRRRHGGDGPNKRKDRMRTQSSLWLTAACFLGLAGAACPALALDSATPAPTPVVTPANPPTRIGFVAHRAVYDLQLGETRGSSSVETMRGRIVYDFSGNACDGYALKFRQVTQIGVSGGGQNTSD